MVLDIRTQTFQDTFDEINELTEREGFLDSQGQVNWELRDNFLRQKGIEPDDYDQALDEYIDAWDKVPEGEELDLRPGGGPGRVAGIVLGQIGEGADWIFDQTLGRIPGMQEVVEEGDKFVNEDILGEEGQKDFQALFDPATGYGPQAVAEQITGEILSYVIPISKAAKIGSAFSKPRALTGLGISSSKANKIAKKLATKKGRLAGYAVAGVGTEAAMRDPVHTMVSNILDDEDASKAMDKLMEDPEDARSRAIMEDFLETLKWEGGFLAAFPVLGKVWKTVGKNRTVQGLVTPLKKWVTAKGGTDDTFFAKVLANKESARASFDEAVGLSEDLGRAAKKDLKRKGIKKGTEQYKDYQLRMNAVLKGGDPENLGDDVVEILGEMRTNIDDMSGSLADDVFGGTLELKINENLESYVNRSYQFFLDPKYQKKIIKDVQRYLDNPNDAKVNSVVKDAANFLMTEGGVARQDLGPALEQLVKTKDTFHAFQAYSNLPGTLKKRQVIPKELSALWGEVKDPYQNYVNTFSNLSRMRAQANFTKGVVDDLLERGIAKTDRAGAGERGMVSLTDELDSLNKKIFGTSEGATEGLDKYIRDAVEEAGGSFKKGEILVGKEYRDVIRDNLNPKNINIALKYWGGAKGITQAMKTIYNPTTHGRNTMGNVAILAANGIVPIGSVLPAAKLMGKKLLGMSDKEMGKELARLQELGIINSRVDLGLIRDNLRGFANQTEEGFSNTFKQRNKLRRLNKKVVDLYQAEDDIFKIMHFEETKKAMRKAHLQDAGESVEDYARRIEEISAQRTRDLMPNYAMVPKLFKAFRYSPVGDFLAFPAEMTRVTKNLVKYTFDDFLSGNPELKKQASKRLAGMTAVGALPLYMQSYTAAQHGIDAEQEQSLERVLPSWFQDTGRVYLSGINESDKTGTMTVDILNLGPLDPFEYIKTGVTGMHRAFLSGDVRPEEADRIAFQTVEKVISPFVGSSMLTDTVLDMYKAIQGGGRPKTYKRGSVGEAVQRTIGQGLLGDVSAAGVQPFLPGFVNFLERRLQHQMAIGAARGEELPLGSYLEGVDPFGIAEGLEPTGYEFTETGRLSDPNSMNLAAFLGIKADRVDLTKGMAVNFERAMRESDAAKRNFNSIINKRNLGPDTRDYVFESYRDANLDSYDSQMLIKDLLDDYGTLGFGFDSVKGREALTRALTDYREEEGAIPDDIWKRLLAALHGRFIPVSLPDSLWDKAGARQGGIDVQGLQNTETSYGGIRLKEEQE